MAYEQPPARKEQSPTGRTLSVILPLGANGADQRKQVELYKRIGYEKTGKTDGHGGMIFTIESSKIEAYQEESRRIARERVTRPGSAGIPNQTEDYVQMGPRRFNAQGVLNREALKALIREEMGSSSGDE